MRGAANDEGSAMIKHSSAGRAIVAAMLLGMVAACSSVPEQSAATHEKKVYRTGSNLPVRDNGAESNVQTADPEALKRAINAPAASPGRSQTGG